jgi:hypothetical protein
MATQQVLYAHDLPRLTTTSNDPGWTLEHCPLHLSRPSRNTRKSCDLCKRYLCSGCGCRESQLNQRTKQCGVCADKKKKRAQRIACAGTRYCGSCQKQRPMEDFLDRNGKEHATCTCYPKNKGPSAQTPTNRVIQAGVSYSPQVLSSILQELMRNVIVPNSDLAYYEQGIYMLAAVVPLLRTLVVTGQHAADYERPESLTSAAHLSHVHWVATSAGELDAFLKTGQSLNENTSTLRIAGTFDRYSDAEAAFLRFASHPAVKLMYQNWMTEGGETHAMPTQQFFERYQSRRSEQIRASFGDFYNFLSITGTALDHIVPEPWFLEKLGYSLLRDLQIEDHLRVQTLFHTAGGKEAKTRTIDCESCFRFVLYGERYSFSGWHLDVLNGTWLTVATGFRAWFIYTGPWTGEEKHAFARAGAHWKPPSQHVEMILLHPGDTLIMRPGHPVVHCVLTLDDSIARGGMIWSAVDMEKIVSNIDFIISRPMTTNEHIPRQLPDYLDLLEKYLCWERPSYLDAELEKQMRRHQFTDGAKETVVAFIRDLKGRKVLSCHCSPTCRVPTEADYHRWYALAGEDPQKKKHDQQRFCRCWWHREELVHVQGCSTWCHPKGILANRRCVG